MNVPNEIQWILKPVPSAQATRKDVPRILSLLLAQRGVEDEKLDSFLHPKLRDLQDPFMLPEMERAVERLFQAIDKGEKVCIFGDYDVDGVTSVALMFRAFQAYGLEVQTFIPKRGPEGYGLSAPALNRLFEENEHIDLLVTVDCGTGSVNEVKSLTERGIEVIIVDHHEMSPAGRPDCVALVNPKSGETDFSYLCAAGVVFKLAHAMMIRRRVESFDLKDFIDMVAVATIADIVPLIDENRIIVRHGLQRLLQTKNKGLKELLGVAGIRSKVSSMDVGFRVGPRLNAAGRMDKPSDALEMLLTDSDADASRIAKLLDNHNLERQSVERVIRSEALDMLEEQAESSSDAVIVLGSRSWHPGVVGIVASRLMRQFHKPTYIISIDEEGMGKGSGRSVEGISLVTAIHECEDLLIAGGGHDMAAGISIHEDKIDGFREAFAKSAEAQMSVEKRMPKIHIDAEVTFEELSLAFLDSYDLLQPFGSKNPQPVFMASNVWLNESPRKLKNNHLRLFMRQEYCEKDAIYFGGGERELPAPPWDIAFTIDRNVYRGVTNLQIVIQDIRKAQSE